MNKLIIKKILGYSDSLQTFVITTKNCDTNRILQVQIVNELTLFDFEKVKSAFLSYRHIYSETSNELDISSSIDVLNSAVSINLSDDIISKSGIILCEIVLLDDNDNIILTTNTFKIKIKDIGGGCK